MEGLKLFDNNALLELASKLSISDLIYYIKLLKLQSKSDDIASSLILAGRNDLAVLLATSNLSGTESDLTLNPEDALPSDVPDVEEIQTPHSPLNVILVSLHLRKTVEDLVDGLFPNCKKRWIPGSFPFTNPR